MPGEVDLNRLLTAMDPLLHEADYVVCTLPRGRYGDRAELEPVAAIVEREGLTLVLERSRADRAGLAYDGVFALITLQIHSSLEAVGLTAAVSTRLADLGISANVLAGYHHDHVLVPRDRAAEALASLVELTRA